MQRARVCSGSGEQTSSPEGLDKRLVEVVVTATIVGVATRGGRVDYRPSVCCGRECRTRVARRCECVNARSHAGGHAIRRRRWVRGGCRAGCADDDAGCGRESRLGKEGAPAGQGRAGQDKGRTAKMQPVTVWLGSASMTVSTSATPPSRARLEHVGARAAGRRCALQKAGRVWCRCSDGALLLLTGVSPRPGTRRIPCLNVRPGAAEPLSLQRWRLRPCNRVTVPLNNPIAAHVSRGMRTVACSPCIHGCPRESSSSANADADTPVGKWNLTPALSVRCEVISHMPPVAASRAFQSSPHLLSFSLHSTRWPLLCSG
jgi:hypothetical protein